ncbi:MAG: ATP phosphoribosyltransferase [Pseudomonadota bacterium]
MKPISIGVPSKGRLQANTIDWFEARGLRIVRDGAEREYSAAVEGMDGVSVVMLSAGEIPRELAAGRIHMGVTGEDLIRERIPEHDSIVSLASKMGFGHADLIVAVPSFWIDVETLHDLDEVSHDFRARHGHALRIATKYHNLTRKFLHEHGVSEYRLVDSQGATEAAPKNMSAEVIVDITSSGETLRANHLKILSDGLILRSEANLCISNSADWSEVAPNARESVMEKLGLTLPSLDR